MESLTGGGGGGEDAGISLPPQDVDNRLEDELDEDGGIRIDRVVRLQDPGGCSMKIRRRVVPNLRCKAQPEGRGEFTFKE